MSAGAVSVSTLTEAAGPASWTMALHRGQCGQRPCTPAHCVLSSRDELSPARSWTVDSPTWPPSGGCSAWPRTSPTGVLSVDVSHLRVHSHLPPTCALTDSQAPSLGLALSSASQECAQEAGGLPAGAECSGPWTGLGERGRAEAAQPRSRPCWGPQCAHRDQSRAWTHAYWACGKRAPCGAWGRGRSQDFWV